MQAFNLDAKLGIDTGDFDKGLDRAESKASSFGSGLVKLIGGGAAIAGTAITAAVGVAATGISVLTKKSVDAYADYEQLVGGVQKLYGNMGQSLEEYAAQTGQSVEEASKEWKKLEKAQTMVMDSAKNAYKTAGMSANEYMEIATSFSASLINSLGGDTVKAAKQTDVAMKAISDNFNTFGGDISNIQNAFQGFAKQNYTMLDNLKLGYGGTKTEMERLIADANEYGKATGQASDLTIKSFSDIVTAIDLIQQKQNIAGTTAREATTTIQGSLGMLGAAWQNLVAGFSDPEADIGQLISNVMESIVGTTDEAGNHINGFLDNLIPVIEQALTSIAQAVTTALPTILDALSGLVDTFLPSLVESATNIVIELGKKLPSLGSHLVEAVKQIFSQIKETLEGSDLVGEGENLFDAILRGLSSAKDKLTEFAANALTWLATALEENLPTLVEKIPELIENVMSSFTDNTQMLIDAALQLVTALGDAITESMPALAEGAGIWMQNIANLIKENLPAIVDAGAELVSNLADTISQNLPTVVNNFMTAVTDIATTIIDAAPTILQAGLDLMVGLADGILASIPAIIDKIPELLNSLVNAILDGIPMIIEAGVQLLESLVGNLPGIINSLAEAIPEIIINLVESLLDHIPDIIQAGFDLLTSLIKNLPAILVNLATAIPKIVTKLVTTLIEKAPELAAKGLEFIGHLFDKIADFIAGIPDAIVGIFTGIWDAIKDWSLVEAGVNLLKGLWEGIVSVKDWIVDKIKGLGNTIIDAAKSVFGIHSPSKVFKDVIGKNIGKGLAQGIKESKKEAVQEAEQMYSELLQYASKSLDNYKVYHKMSLKEEKEYWDAIRKQMKKGTQARVDADKQYFAARDALKEAKKQAKAQAKELTKEYLSEYNKIVKNRDTKITQIREALAKNLKKIDEGVVEDLKSIDDELAKDIEAVNEKLADDIERLTDQYNKSVESRTNAIMGMTSLFSRTSFDKTYSKEYLADALSEQVDTLESWDNELDQLESKLGRDNPLLEYLQEMGVSSLYTLQEINSMSEDELKAYSDLYAKKSQIANDRAVQENEGLLEETNKQIETLRAQAETDIAEYQRIAETNRQTVRDEAAKQRAELQAEAEEDIKVLTEEADEQLKELTKTYKKNMKALAKMVKEEGKDVGKKMAEGIAQGVKESKEIIQAAAKKAAQEALAAARAALGIKSPSKEFAKLGKFVDEGFAEGIAQNAKLVQDEVNKIVDIPTNVAGDISSSIVSNNNSTTNSEGGFIQNLTVNAPTELQPSEIARQTKLANQQMVLALRGI